MLSDIAAPGDGRTPAPPPTRQPDALALSTGGARLAGNKIRQRARQGILSTRDAYQHVQCEVHYWLVLRAQTMTLGCYFTASGAKFDVDSFLEATSLEANAVFHRGEPLKYLKGKLKKVSGFSVTVNHTRVFGDLGPQIPKALCFLRKE